MEQSTVSSLSNTDDEREVSEILLNLPNLINQSKSRFNLPVWGNRRRRSAINLIPSPPHYRRPEKKAKIVAGESSPATPLSFSPSESDDKTYQSRKIVPSKKTREELLEKINELAQVKESLTKELERVKGYYDNLEVYNKVLKTKQQELQFRQSELNVDQSKLSQNKTPFPFLLQQQQIISPNSFKNFQIPCNQTPSLPPPPYAPANAGPLVLPDLNMSADEALDEEHLQPWDQTVQSLDGYCYKAKAAEARKRRMERVKEMKLNLAPFRPPKS